jgi:hypothetical protein
VKTGGFIKAGAVKSGGVVKAGAVKAGGFAKAGAVKSGGFIKAGAVKVGSVATTSNLVGVGAVGVVGASANANRVPASNVLVDTKLEELQIEHQLQDIDQQSNQDF